MNPGSFWPRGTKSGGSKGPSAKAVLHQLEASETAGKAEKLIDDLPLFSVAVRQELPKKTKDNPALAELGSINPDELTPREALEALYRLKALAGK